MSRTPLTDERYADALASPKHAGDWKYVAEEMARLCRVLESGRPNDDAISASHNRGYLAGVSECRGNTRRCFAALEARKTAGEDLDFDKIWEEVMSCLP